MGGVGGGQGRCFNPWGRAGHHVGLRAVLIECRDRETVEEPEETEVTERRNGANAAGSEMEKRLFLEVHWW